MFQLLNDFIGKTLIVIYAENSIKFFFGQFKIYSFVVRDLCDVVFRLCLLLSSGRCCFFERRITLSRVRRFSEKSSYFGSDFQVFHTLIR